MSTHNVILTEKSLQERAFLWNLRNNWEKVHVTEQAASKDVFDQKLIGDIFYRISYYLYGTLNNRPNLSDILNLEMMAPLGRSLLWVAQNSFQNNTTYIVVDDQKEDRIVIYHAPEDTSLWEFLQQYDPGKRDI